MLYSTQPIKNILTIAANIQQAEQMLLTSPTRRLDAEILLANVIQRPRSFLYSHPDELLTTVQQAFWQSYLHRRLAGEPIAYILGYKEFWSLEIAVTPATLIPRPETELLVEIALELLPSNTPQLVADLGTGSGAIAVALAHERPIWQLEAIDNSPAAIQIVQANAKRLNLANINPKLSNWYEDLAVNRPYHAIISNPPYIAANDPHLSLGDVRFEPESALIAGQRGLDALHTIIRQAPQYLVKEGWLMLEHGYNQQEEVRQLLINYGYQGIRNYKDLAGISRVTVAFNNSIS